MCWKGEKGAPQTTHMCDALAIVIEHLRLDEPGWNTPYCHIRMCLCAAKEIVNHSPHLANLRQRVRRLSHKLAKAPKSKACSSCLKYGRFANHYGLCGVCRPHLKPEISRRSLAEDVGMPYAFVRNMPRRPQTLQYAVTFDDVWDFYLTLKRQKPKREKCPMLGRMWLKRMSAYSTKEEFIRAYHHPL